MSKDLSNIVELSESVLYKGRPNFIYYLFKNFFNKKLFITLVWCFILYKTVFPMLIECAKQPSQILPIVISLFPLWIFPISFVLSLFKYRNIYYVVTNRNAYELSGLFKTKVKKVALSQVYEVKSFKDCFSLLFSLENIYIAAPLLNGGRTISLKFYGVDKFESLMEKLQNISRIVNPIDGDNVKTSINGEFETNYYD